MSWNPSKRPACTKMSVSSQLLNDKDKELLEANLNNKYAQLRSEYSESQKTLASIEDARNNKLRLF